MMMDQTILENKNDHSTILKSDFQALQRSDPKERSYNSISNSCSGVISKNSEMSPGNIASDRHFPKFKQNLVKEAFYKREKTATIQLSTSDKRQTLKKYLTGSACIELQRGSSKGSLKRHKGFMMSSKTSNLHGSSVHSNTSNSSKTIVKTRREKIPSTITSLKKTSSSSKKRAALSKS
mmetsp:Transcript_4506/g.4205  ORF Transcript_4506/g.4205 Transcript_4506/m.4205 type:complete len:179 (-) Transcript_4506:341-877(-)